MASLALSAVGSAIGGPLGGMVGGFLGGMLDNVLFPAAETPPPAITSSTYGQSLPLLYGPKVRVGCNMHFTSGWRKAKGKAAKFASMKGAPPAYEADLAFTVAEGPLESDWLRRIYANGTVIFDADLAASPPVPDANGVVTYTFDHKTHKDFDTLVVYPGVLDPDPDPTIEAAKGVGNCSAYVGTAYFVINALVGTTFGNAVPLLQLAVRAQAAIGINQVVEDICARCGLNPHTVSTSSLAGLLDGYVIDAQSDGITALQPLALCYDFDLAEVSGGLRFTPRGQPPVATIENDRLAGHEAGAARPSFEWPIEPETTLPKVAALTFIDPDRDLQQNTQSARRSTGSAQSQLSTSVKITLTSDQARKIADRMLWEAVIGRQTLNAATDDRLGWVEAARTYSIEVPFGYETLRVTKRTRGANGVIEFEGKRDASAIYQSQALGQAAAPAPNVLAIGGPVNPPQFVEPPAGFPGITAATLLIAISGGDGTTVDPAWSGCNVYVSTDDISGDYQLAGFQIGAACMGVLTAGLAAFAGSNPDAAHTLSITTAMSDGEPIAMTATDAADAQQPYAIGSEFLTAEAVAALGSDAFDLTNLWRGLYGSAASSHLAGAPIARCDGSIFKFPLSDVYIGRTLYFRFVGAGDNLATATTYTYTPIGAFDASEGAIGALPASEALAAGDLVNVWSDAGVAKLRKADADYLDRQADGFVKLAAALGAVVPFFGPGQVDDRLSGLTPGATYYVGTAAGQVQIAAPTAGGSLYQVAGNAISATELLFAPGEPDEVVNTVLGVDDGRPGVLLGTSTGKALGAT